MNLNWWVFLSGINLFEQVKPQDNHFSLFTSMSNILVQSWVSSDLGYRFSYQLTNSPAETIYPIKQRLPWRPSCHGVTRWHHSRSHLSEPTDAMRSRSGTDCDSCVTSQAQQAVMLSRASAVLRPIWPFLDVRMQWLCECSVGHLIICDKSVSPFYPLCSWEMNSHSDWKSWHGLHTSVTNLQFSF